MTTRKFYNHVGGDLVGEKLPATANRHPPLREGEDDYDDGTMVALIIYSIVDNFNILIMV